MFFFTLDRILPERLESGLVFPVCFGSAAAAAAAADEEWDGLIEDDIVDGLSTGSLGKSRLYLREGNKAESTRE